MKHLEKVREALDKVGLFDREDRNAMDAALSALQAHEEEVRELVEALTLALPYVEEAMNDPGYKSGAVGKTLMIMFAALRPFTGDEK